MFSWCVIDNRVYYKLVFSLPVTWAMARTVKNMVTYASRVSRDLRGVSFQLVLGGGVVVFGTCLIMMTHHTPSLRPPIKHIRR